VQWLPILFVLRSFCCIPFLNRHILWLILSYILLLCCRNAAAASQQATAVPLRAKLARRSWPCRADGPPNDIAARAGGPAHYRRRGPVFRRLRVGQRLHGESHTRGKPNFVVKADDGHWISDVARTGWYTKLSAMILIDFPLLYTAIVNAVLVTG